LQFNGNNSSIALELPAGSPFLGGHLSGSDSFALQFTLKGTSPETKTAIVAGALIDSDESGRYGYAPAPLRPANPSARISDSGTGASTIKKLGFVVHPLPAVRNKWPTAGGTVEILVEPAPDAIPIEDTGRLKSNSP